VKGDERDGKRSRKPRQSGDMSFDTKSRHRYQEYEQWESGESGREQPRMRRIVTLPPGGELWESLEDYRHDCQSGCNCGDPNEGASPPEWLRRAMLRRSERRLFGQHGSRGRRLRGVVDGLLIFVVWCGDKVFDANLANNFDG
jgi:hypothetical protein